MADVYRHAGLPGGCSWNTQDYSIVNSSGVGNDPLGKIWPFGGEANTRPTPTPEAQAEVCDEVFRLVRPSVNYRCNLHVHVRVPGLAEDVPAVKRLQAYVRDNDREVFRLIEPVPEPEPAGMAADEYAGAVVRYKRRLVSHQTRLPGSFHSRVMAARTPAELRRALQLADSSGRYTFRCVPRAAVNLLPLFGPTGTVEFRHFPMTLDPSVVLACVAWCREFLDSALNTPGRTPADVLAGNPWMRFPGFEPYRHDLEVLYLFTSPGVVGRRVASANVARLVSEGRVPRP